MSSEDRDKPDNLLLLCGYHHDEVDTQYEEFPAEMLRGWKKDRELRYLSSLEAKSGEIGMAELEVAAGALIAGDPTLHADLTAPIPPAEKLEKNGLGDRSRILIATGAAKARDVEAFLIQSAQLDDGIPIRLKEGFTTKYNELIADGAAGDTLFTLLYLWAQGPDPEDYARHAAGLAILSHLFIICDVFES